VSNDRSFSADKAAAEHKQKILVVKVGTSTLTDAPGHIDTGYLDYFARQISEVRKNGIKPIVVTSASIACGMGVLGIEERPSATAALQAVASVGTIELSRLYAEAFARVGILTSSILLTRNDTKDRSSYIHARDTIRQLLAWDVVPIINENDTVSVEQVHFGDNDTLSALVACLIKADEAVIFSDIDGLFDKNPATHPDAQLIRRVESISPEIMAMAEGPGSKQGSGGMITKIRAARVLLAAGIPLTICHGRRKDALVDVVKGREVGTRFENQATPHEITPKKLWIALGDSARGSLVVDEGARAALVGKGSSLLAVGVVEIGGEFEEDDIVDIVDEHGHLFARGKVGASSDEARLACGHSQQDLAGNRLLAHLADRPLVHRDDLIVFE
jgi:glutamate 5-kinase